jgi:hypothetical protein
VPISERVKTHWWRVALVVDHTVCAELWTLAPDAVRVEWYVD